MLGYRVHQVFSVVQLALIKVALVLCIYGIIPVGETLAAVAVVLLIELVMHAWLSDYRVIDVAELKKRVK